MEAFNLLSRGGAQFDKRRFQRDVKLFTSTKEKTASATPKSSDGQLPAELDFFKYAQSTGNGKRKDAEADERSKKRQKTTEDNSADGTAEDGLDGEESCATAKHRVTTRGSNVPPPAETFEDLQQRYNVPPRLLTNLRESGYRTPTSIQAYGAPILLSARDLAAISPTGTGKTLSYLLPVFAALRSPSHSKSKNDSDPPTSGGAERAVGEGVRALIIAPTRELAHQIHNECLKLAQGRKWRIILFSKATAATLVDKNVRDNVDIIISTPLRLVSALGSNSISLSNVRHLVLDEADRLLDAEFLPQLQDIIAACTHPSCQKAVFSATLPAGVEKIAMGMMKDPVRVVVGLKDTPLPHIQQSLVYVADDASKLPTLVAHLNRPYTPPVIIFTSTQPRASSLAENLVLYSIPRVGCLHAGMTKKQREDTIRGVKAGEVWVLVCTEVMARGMDFRGVREVVNYDFPASVQSYVHRIGRTGRAGREGKAVTYFTNEDAPYLKSIANVLLQSGQPVPEWISSLPKPSKMKRKLMGKVKRAEEVDVKGTIVGKREAKKKREMIEGSRRRKEKAAAKVREGGGGNQDEDEEEWGGLGGDDE
ncbi:P-loop containing nucleoside triphosphate hydrolase protein [Punctularia strigosozonata HHB-11173 SS5]|uniref:P-loop containing nucleoside triphosphate hydrolase protein n=1 Tax=Punctularia strigosozonata (strain HHB-11173) TaxID=741275 RepID=UPI00044181BD|nr:P-loop containing nucleoside triphosphate hydrolase protein [Punctularia strigosozonata HHB-11173 SS5]EIN13475.1 P-loop containing nucleoside triphosphate hydrolase protein [Punctularia strigosozonata HHB-11173 SS5]